MKKVNLLEKSKRIIQLEGVVLKQLGRKPKLTLRKGPYLYGYLVNGVLKAGDSLINNTGRHARATSHATSVARLKYDYFFYLEEYQIILFRDFFKLRFEREQQNREFFLCTVLEATEFIIQICTAFK